MRTETVELMDRRAVLTVGPKELSQLSKFVTGVFDGGKAVVVNLNAEYQEIDGHLGSERFVHRMITGGRRINVGTSFPVGPGLWLVLRHTVVGGDQIQQRFVISGESVPIEKAQLSGTPELTKSVIPLEVTQQLNTEAVKIDKDPVDGSTADFPDFDIDLWEGPDGGEYLWPSPDVPKALERTYTITYLGLHDQEMKEQLKYNYPKDTPSAPEISKALGSGMLIPCYLVRCAMKGDNVGQIRRSRSHITSWKTCFQLATWDTPT